MLVGRGIRLDDKIVREPAAGRGTMVEPLREFFNGVIGSDIHDYGVGLPVRDYLDPEAEEPWVDWTITNPPFNKAVEFFRAAAESTSLGVALLTRISFVEGVSRYKELYSVNKPAFIFQFTERVCMHKGVLRDPSEKYWDPVIRKWKKPTTATAYCWMVWLGGQSFDGHPYDTKFDWIEPCRKKLEHPGDYLMPRIVV